MEPAISISYLAVRKWKNCQVLRVLVFFTFLSASSHDSFAQQRVLDVGIRVQKTINLYYENGLTIQYSSETLAAERVYFGLSYVSSRFGTAMGSNAIQQDNFLFSTSYFFRPEKLIRPLLRANIGYFRAPLEPVFDDLPQSSMLLSSEAGICIDPQLPLKITSSIGYNFITGDGLSGPGTLYPVFIQTSLSWDVFYKKGNRK